MPEGPTLVIDPAGSCDLWELGVELQDTTIAGQDDTSPVMADVRLIGTSLSGARQLRVPPTAVNSARPLVWGVENEPLCLAFERPEGRVLVLSGKLEQGSLPLQSAFPVLVSSALDWLAGMEGDPPVEPSLADRPLLAESDLRVPDELGVDVSDLKARRPWLPPWVHLAVLGMALLVAEWCLYQRRWMS
jgi:hypothetical protein